MGRFSTFGGQRLGREADRRLDAGWPMEMQTIRRRWSAIKSRWFGPQGRRPAFPVRKVLVLEGGGMRGIFPTGVLQAFSDRGYFPWKLIIGSSAGALTGTAYAAGQIHLARDAFFTELNTGKLFRLSNLLRPEKHVLNLDWMLATILGGVEPLDLNRLQRACPVLITATDCRSNQPPRTVYLHSHKDDVFTALKATAAIPYLYRGFVAYDRHMLLDGSLLDPLPYRKALSMGYRDEDIVVVATHTKGYRKKHESFWVRALYESYYRKEKHRFLVTALENRYMAYNRVLEELENQHPRIAVLYPPQEFRVNRFTRDEEKFVQGFEQGVDVARNYLLGRRPPHG